MVVNMEQIPCAYCGDFFDPSPRHKNQTACKKPECQKDKKAAWQRFKSNASRSCAMRRQVDPAFRYGEDDRSFQ